MSDFDPATFPLQRRGRTFEDFQVGQRFEHHWGRTLTEADNAIFTTATLAYNPLYFNAEHARAAGHPGVVVNPMLVLCTVVGLSVEDLSEAGGPFLGVDAATFSSLADAPDVIQDVVRMRAASKEEHILLGIDRLDYTKGIPRRLLAVERLLERDPSLRGKVKLLQVAVPSRDKVTAYQDFRRDVEHLAGRINGAHATVDSAPIHYIYRSFSAR